MLSIWLGNRQSQDPVVQMQKAVSEGKLIELMASSEKAMSLSMRDNDDEYRIGEELLQINAGVAVISVKGSLVPDYKWYNYLFGVVSYEEIRDAFNMAAEDRNVKSILLDVDSSGGAVTYLDETTDYIKNIDANLKPVYGHTTSHCHSAGYWLLAATRKISAAKMASSGSIGVIMTLVNYSKAYENEGVEFKYIRSGKFKALGQSGEKLTEEAEADYLDMVMQLHTFFEDHVIASRGSAALQNKAKWNEGKTFFSKQSLELGLIDEINTFDGHISKLYDTNHIRFGTNMSATELKTIGDNAMKKKLLSTSQAAKFASGVPLTDLGLSAENLTAIQAEIAKDATEEKPTVPAVEAETETELPAANEGEEVAPKAVDIDKIIELSGKVATMTVELATATSALAAANIENEKITTMQTTLVGIVAEATGRFQVALGKSASNFEGATAESIVGQYNAEKSVLFGVMPSGASSSQQINDRQEEDNLSLQQKAGNTIIKLGDK